MAEPASTLAAGPAGPGTAGTVGPGSVGTVETQYLDLPEPVRLDCGRELHPIRVAYETYGALAPRRDNVILVCHALSGDAHAAGFGEDAARSEHARRVRGRGPRRHGRQGARLVGRDDRPRQGGRHPALLRRLRQRPGRMPRLDGAQLGRARRPGTGAYGLRGSRSSRSGTWSTPRRLPGRARYRRLEAVMGGSMGGMKALEWAILFPHRSRQSGDRPQNALPRRRHVERGRARSDHARPGLERRRLLGTGARPMATGVARMVAHVTYLSALARNESSGGGSSSPGACLHLHEPEFEVESYLRHQAELFHQPVRRELLPLHHARDRPSSTRRAPLRPDRSRRRWRTFRRGRC